MGANLDAAWREQVVWSRIASRLKSGLETKRRTVLALAIAGAACSATAAGLGLGTGPGKGFAFASAVGIGLAACVQALIGPSAVRDWTRARSASEAIKSEVYSALAGFGPADLDAQVKKISEDVDDLRGHRVAVAVPPDPPPAVHDLASYLKLRVDNQIHDYYDKRARELTGTLRWFRGFGFGFAAIGVVFGAWAGTWEVDWMAIWVPVITTISAAVVAHVAAGRYSYLLVEYVRTADELRRIRDRIGESATLTDEQLVRRAERIISIQNEGWMAKLSAPGDPH
jgi:hypothetical protein